MHNLSTAYIAFNRCLGSVFVTYIERNIYHYQLSIIGFMKSHNQLIKYDLKCDLRMRVEFVVGQMISVQIWFHTSYLLVSIWRRTFSRWNWQLETIFRIRTLSNLLDFFFCSFVRFCSFCCWNREREREREDKIITTTQSPQNPRPRENVSIKRFSLLLLCKSNKNASLSKR